MEVSHRIFTKMFGMSADCVTILSSELTASVSSLRRSGVARVNERSHSFTCHPHTYPLVEWATPAFTPQPHAENRRPAGGQVMGNSQIRPQCLPNRSTFSFTSHWRKLIFRTTYGRPYPPHKILVCFDHVRVLSERPICHCKFFFPHFYQWQAWSR